MGTGWFHPRYEAVLNRPSVKTRFTILGGLLVIAGVIGFVLAPIVGEAIFTKLWAIEPLAVIGTVLLIAGLGITTLAYVVPHVIATRGADEAVEEVTDERWSQVTQQYFELFDHDLGRPLRRILGKERELRAVLQSSGAGVDPVVNELLDEIERQTPNFRLMMSNIRVLVQLEAPNVPVHLEPVEPSEVVQKIIDRYSQMVGESGKGITWWAEPAEFGIVYSDSSAIEHIATNLVDNAVRFADSQLEVKITKNPSHFFIRVWDDGPGIPSHYLQHVFDRGWTPEVARREEKPSSGLGLFIARTLANRYGGDISVESVAAPDSNHHTAFLLSLPLEKSEVTLR